MDDKLRNLIDEALNIFENREVKSQIVTSSIPILFFGDYTLEPKVITVGLNPSRLEFPDNNRYQRFPLMEGWTRESFCYETYVESCCRYFDEQPYHWFQNYEEILKGLDASFKLNGNNGTSIHTDICSPLATEKSWRHLGTDTKQRLTLAGTPLWKSLVSYLHPKLIIAQVGLEHLKVLGPQQSWRTVPVPETVLGTESEIMVLRKKLNSHASTTVHWKPIRPSYTPFGDLTPKERFRLGQFIRDRICSLN
jgi:hypothetical protein